MNKIRTEITEEIVEVTIEFENGKKISYSHGGFLDKFLKPMLQEAEQIGLVSGFNEGYKIGLGDKRLVDAANDGLGDLLKRTEEVLVELKGKPDGK